MKTPSVIVGWIVLLVGALAAWAQDPSPDPVAAPAAPAAPAPSAASAAPATPAGQDGEMAPEGPPQEPGDSGAGPAPTKPPANPYQGVFYDNDFSYLEGPSTAERHFGDMWKRLHLGECMVFDVGGEYRLRQHNEHILTRDNDFLLQRTRVYGNLGIQGWIRLYAEAIDATSSWEDLPPRAIEENRFDALNLFGEVRVLDGCRGDLWLRAGRQELLYGAQRLISPLDWANTRRTFDGARLLWKGEDWNADAFWVRPVPQAQHLGNDHNFDHPDSSQEFFGVYLTRKGWESHKLDLYYLRYAEHEGRPDFSYHTLGGRWEGQRDNWLGEIEAGYQFGEFGPRDHSAGFYTVGVGRKLARLPWSPVLWAYYDWASGDRDPNDSLHGTFNQLFPLGHKYFGWMDIVGRQNIEDWNFQLTFTPHPAAAITLWGHVFRLQQARDALYDASGSPLRQDPTGAAGRDVGQELDVTLKWTLTPRANVLFGCSHLWPGAFLFDTPGGAGGRDFYYTQLTATF